ncbi:zincin-like metallopeptidase domain-containing protein [Acidisoma sp. S159]|uniref:zincin-like metallopeptidase domain-containing protein n=1 Tax=Acidisoma sp. S159 TaxID=1747225 RepID=UPI00131B1CFD
MIPNAALCDLCRYRHKSHWTGGKDRLDRGLSSRFGSAAYAQEELRAELASVFLGKVLDLPSDIPNHASYLGSWIETLKADKREIFRAASDAQRIADYLLAFHPDYAVQADISTESEAPRTALAA